MEILLSILNIFFGAADGLMYALLVSVVLDYITGICVAVHQRKLSSNIGARGIAKKVAIFALVSVSHIIDTYVLQTDGAIRSITTSFYLANECLSILENAGKLGLPLPEKLKKVIQTLKPKSNENEIETPEDNSSQNT